MGGSIARSRSEAKHMVQAERARAKHTVIAEQPAGHVAYDGVAMLARLAAFFRAEDFVRAQQQRSTAGDLELPLGDFGSARTDQRQRRVRMRVPRERRRID